MMRLTLTLHPAVWLTANQRLHWSTRMQRTRMLRAPRSQRSAPLAASEARITGAAGKRLGASTVTALLTQLKPGAVIDDAGVDVNGPFAGTRRLIINYREPAQKGN